MGRRGPHPTTPLSAALTIQLWREAHSGRDPRCQDEGTGPLLYHQTYFHIFGVSMWQDMLWVADEVLSSPPVPVEVSAPPRLKPCKNDVGCPTCKGMIPDEGAHIRYCHQCREYQGWIALKFDMAMLEPMVTRHHLNRYGIGRDGWFEDEVDV